MVYCGVRYDCDMVAFELDSPAQVNLFLMGEEPFVESPYPVEQFGPDHQACSAGPQYILGLVILPEILFRPVQHPSPAERVAVFV